jgi:hypothetical protein
MKKTELDDKKTGHRKRPFIGVIFKCCRVYSRIYLNKKKNAFVGWCPKCGAKMEVLISPTGSKSSFFIAE